MERIILVRHGQTEWNIERRYQGQQDTDLTDLGRQQMVSAASWLESESIDKLVTSPLKRAKESADIVAEACGLHTQIDHRLTELYLGRWEGQPYSTGRRVDNWFKLAPHGGEKGTLFHNRIKNWLICQPIIKELADDTVLLVVHGLVVQSMLSLLLKESFDVWHKRPVKNGSIAELVKRGDSWRLVRFNQEVAGGKGQGANAV